MSVIIPAFNEAGYIPETLDRLGAAEQHFKAISDAAVQILVVDNASTDRTAELAQSAGATVIPEAEHNIARVCTCYFGSARIESYGISPLGNVPITQDLKGRAEVDCLAAISVTPLYGLYVPAENYAWLRARTPMAKIGYSIYVFDLRKTR